MIAVGLTIELLLIQICKSGSVILLLNLFRLFCLSIKYSANALVRSSIRDFLRFSCTKKSALVHFEISVNGLLIIGDESFISGIQVYLYDVKNYSQQSWLFSYEGLISVYNLHFLTSSASL